MTIRKHRRYNDPILFEEFLERVIKSHGGDVFEFDKSEYESLNSTLTVTCRECHRKFERSGYMLQTGQKCPFCEKDKKVKEFIEKAKKKFGERFSYKLVPDTFNTILCGNKNVTIICNKCHKNFNTNRNNFLRGDGKCPHCKQLKIAKKHKRDFIKIATKNFGDRFSYDKVSYKDWMGGPFCMDFMPNPLVEIFCNKCKKYFIISEKSFLKSGFCKECEKEKRRKISKKLFLEKAKEKYKDLYDYKKMEYVNDQTPIEIICNKCGDVFTITPYGHIHNKYGGCKTCEVKEPIKPTSTSKGEKLIKELLEYNNIKYIHQKTFNGCKDKKFLRFDFYLPDQNLCIEYQGQQHYNNKFFLSFCKTKKEGKEKFKIQRIHDKIKKQYCKDNNIDLFEITYKDNVEEKLIEILNLK